MRVRLPTPSRGLALGLGAALIALAFAPPARAGGGPERTVVVVNADSPVSLQVAHDFARRRSIPPSHLIYLDGVPNLKVVDLETYRTRLWAPVKAALAERGLLEGDGAVDLLAWSAGFPFAVDVAAEAKEKKVESLQHVPLRASLTGLTYYWRHLEAHDPARYLDLHANRYFHADTSSKSANPMGRQLTSAEAALMRTAQEALQKKDYAAAKDALTEFTKAAPDVMGGWYDLACCHARLSDTTAALKALEQAVDRGWSDAFHTLNDPDLEALRTLEAFQALVGRMKKDEGVSLASHAFRSGGLWSPDGSPLRGLVGDAAEPPRDRYLLSVMLGYTGEWGNSAPEVLDCLVRGARSDGTQPDGTVYLLANDDVRADTRERFFPFTARVLQALGRKVKVLTKGEDGQDGVVPSGKRDVIGAVLGAAGLAWAGSGSTLLPGAIAEHLTSFGADFSHGSQTKLSELIRAGSAGSSGTVAEPLALWQKFPLPVVHAHYARGCSLAEAYYQSMAGPWQTLVVGDPLARPFARFAAVSIAAPEGDAALSGTVAVRAQVTEAVTPGEEKGDFDLTPSQLELWVDGRYVTSAQLDQPLSWDTTQEDDGVHELRVVHVEGDDIATRSHALRSVSVANAGRTVTSQGFREMPRYGAKATLTGKAADADAVDLLLGARVLATAPVRSGGFKLEVDTLALGPAPVALVVRARFATGPAARSAPLEIAPGTGHASAKPPASKPKKPKEAKPGAGGPGAGLKLVATDAKKKAYEGVLPALTDEALTKALADLKVPEPAQLTLHGEIQVAAEGFYELVLASAGKLEVRWGEQRALETAAAAPDRLAFAGAWLKSGWNPIEITLVPQGAPRLTAILGGQVVATPVAPAALRR